MKLIKNSSHMGECDMSVDVSFSPIQVKQLLFKKVLIEPRKPVDDDEGLWAPQFDFEGVEIKTDIMTAYDENEDDPTHFMVCVRIQIANEKKDGAKLAPYTVDVEGQAFIHLLAPFPAEMRESIVSVNGSTVVVGAIRELVSQLTSRSLYGPMVLPTLRFQSGEHKA
ncbi:hypothetical protein [Endozoicomonas sp.]|uniref:hypothetical protein n=1 Tax=Endozoicomonas sp. TaxID=1892382 RepID=UPI00383B788E